MEHLTDTNGVVRVDLTKGHFHFMVLDAGIGRIRQHPATGFTIALLAHDRARGGAVTQLTTGLDHLGSTAETREELDEWRVRFDEHGVVCTPGRESELGYHLDSRDPDDIALELSSPEPVMLEAQRALSAGRTREAEIAASFEERFPLRP